MKRWIPLALLILLATPAPTFAASDGAARGLTIAQEAERRDAGWRDSTVALTMILQDRRGQTRERRMRLSMLEKPGNAGDKTLTIFDSPPDMAGTLFLSHAVVGADDNLWLYLPSLKRVKRISSANKTGAYFGSEFAYEDISAQEIGKYTYNYVGNKPCGRLTCFVVERYPAYRNSGYRALVTYFDTAEYRPQRIEYIDRSGRLLKVLTFSGYKRYAGRFWRAQTMTMQNRNTSKTTVLRYGQYAFRIGLTDAYFSQGNLRNIQ
jgi:outer membrane lipoprotein-sorting protein